jgi:2-keto-4-pentenoate hydratase
MNAISEDPRIRRGMEAQLARRRTLLAAGKRPIGWKVGFGAPSWLEKLAISGPLVGFLTDGGLVAPGATASLAGWGKPVAEPELAIHMGRGLAPGADDATARAAIAAVGPVIELADLDPPPEDVEAILSGNIYHRHVLLGPKDESRAGARLDGLTARVRRNGEEFAAITELEANTGPVVAIVRHVADVLGSLGEELKAGEFVICGSVVPPIFLESGDREIGYELEPVGSVSVRLEWSG